MVNQYSRSQAIVLLSLINGWSGQNRWYIQSVEQATRRWSENSVSEKSGGHIDCRAIEHTTWFGTCDLTSRVKHELQTKSLARQLWHAYHSQTKKLGAVGKWWDRKSLKKLNIFSVICQCVAVQTSAKKNRYEQNTLKVIFPRFCIFSSFISSVNSWAPFQTMPSVHLIYQCNIALVARLRSHNNKVLNIRGLRNCPPKPVAIDTRTLDVL